MTVLLPFAKLKRTRSDDLHFACGLVLLIGRQHDQWIGRAFKQVDKHGVGALEMHDERIRIGRLVFFNVREKRCISRDFRKALKRGQHVRGSHLLTGG